jgi:hypothetical protein
MPNNKSANMHEYYIRNKSRILDAVNAPVERECGCSVHKSEDSSHAKAYKHQKYMLRKGFPNSCCDVVEKIYVLANKLSREDKALIGNGIDSMLVH